MKIRHKLTIVSAFALTICVATANAQQQLPIPAPPVRSVTGFSLRLAGGSFLGVQTENVSNENLAKYNLTEARGVGISSVTKASPAAKAGLQKGDVIIAFEGETIKSEAKLMRLINEVAPDQKAEITVLRNGGELKLTVMMGKRDEPAFRAFGNGNGLVIPAAPGELRQLQVPPRDFGEGLNAPNADDNFYIFGQNGRKLGVTVTPLTKQLGDYFGANGRQGVLINEIKPDSAAARAGLRAGDIILEIDAAKIAEQADLVRVLNQKTEGDVNITILRDKQQQTVRAAPDAKKATPPRALSPQ